MRGKVEPYMTYVEIAPHNKGEKRTYDHVAGCLIAFACRLSIKNGTGDYRGWLAFDVLEENGKDTIKLMAVYSLKYKAMRFGDTSMLITPTAGEVLIEEYLKR
jgi:hypothetical protein